MIDLEMLEYLDSIDSDLKEKKDRSDELDELFQLTLYGDSDIKRRVSWSVAKMGQNKVPDMRILDILATMHDDPDPEVRENVAWGIGEVAGIGIGDDRSLSIILGLMSDQEDNVRGMAVWAAGRLRKKLSMDGGIVDRLDVMSDEESGYVKKCVLFAFDD